MTGPVDRSGPDHEPERAQHDHEGVQDQERRPLRTLDSLPHHSSHHPVPTDGTQEQVRAVGLAHRADRKGEVRNRSSATTTGPYGRS